MHYPNYNSIVDVKEYMRSAFCPLDIIGTTSDSFMAQLIWKHTWRKGKLFSMFIPYLQRAHLSTHIAMAVLGKDGRKWIMEMDGTVLQDRYLNVQESAMIDPLEFDCLSPGDQSLFKKVKVNSGLMLRPFDKYITDNVKKDHVCWIGRSLGIRDDAARMRANELLFRYYRSGVEYDYKDLFTFPKLLRKWKLHGTDDVFICSELPQRIFQQLGVIKNTEHLMSPMDWQNDRTITYNVRECRL